MCLFTILPIKEMQHTLSPIPSSSNLMVSTHIISFYLQFLTFFFNFVIFQDIKKISEEKYRRISLTGIPLREVSVIKIMKSLIRKRC